MSTMYYFQTRSDVCECCGQPTETEKRYTIGLSSDDWVFCLQWNAEEKLYSLERWIKFLLETKGVIVNEQGNAITLERLLEVILIRSAASPPTFEMMKANNSAQGPNYLMRALEDKDTTWPNSSVATYVMNKRPME